MTVVLVGTLDTKGEELAYAAQTLAENGVDVHVVDVGVLGAPAFDPDTAAEEVAAAAGTSLDALRERGDRGDAVRSMGEGAAKIVSRLHEEGRVDGVLGLGGSGNTSMATRAMRALPVGVPKLMVSTVAAGDVEPYVGTTDVTLMHSVADVEGLNRLSRTVIANAAHAMAGMATGDGAVEGGDEPTVGVTMFGVTTPCVTAARERLEAAGYETIVFHATGTGGRTMERLVREGVLDGVLDVTTTEWADELVGGVLGAGPDRLDAAAETGTPQVVSCGALDMVNFGPREAVPDEFAGRRFHAHNPQVTLMRTTPDECARLGQVLARKLNRATGPTALALPLGGVSAIDVPGEPFHDPEADRALFDALRSHLDDRVDLVEVDAAINDEAFARRIAGKLDEYLRDVGADQGP